MTRYSIRNIWHSVHEICPTNSTSCKGNFKWYSPHIVIGACSSNSMGWLRKISVDLRQRYCISFSDRLINEACSHPRAGQASRSNRVEPQDQWPIAAAMLVECNKTHTPSSQLQLMGDELLEQQRDLKHIYIYMYMYIYVYVYIPVDWHISCNRSMIRVHRWY